MEGIRATGMEGEGLEEECRIELKEQIMKQTHQRVFRRGGGGGGRSRPETHIKRQVTRLDCLPSLLGDEGK